MKTICMLALAGIAALLTHDSREEISAKVEQAVIVEQTKQTLSHLVLVRDGSHWKARLAPEKRRAKVAASLASDCPALDASAIRAAMDDLAAQPATAISADLTRLSVTPTLVSPADVPTLDRPRPTPKDPNDRTLWIDASGVGLDTARDLAVACSANWRGPMAGEGSCFALTAGSGGNWSIACKTGVLAW